MQKSCKYCGRIVDKNHICPKKPIRDFHKGDTEADRFRWTKAWQYKRAHIKKRDNHICQICARKLHNTYGLQYNFTNIQVHHIEPLVNRYDLRLEDTNLISLCEYHHKMAEVGEIPKEELRKIVDEQERAYNGF